jgi:hypothetical protein
MDNSMPTDDFLSHESLLSWRKKSAAWRLLSSSQAPFVISFLYRAFIAANMRERLESELQEQLESYLAKLNGSEAGGEDAGTRLYPRSAREYLGEWANDEHQWLRKFYPQGSDEPAYDVTPQAQLAIEWLAEQRPQPLLAFVGTESRLRTVFDLLQQIIDGTELDPARRIQTLEQQKASIDAQIEAVKSGRFSAYDPTQVRERLAQAISTAHDIQADFRAVEQNFRDLDRSMRERVSTHNAGKGELLQEIFDDSSGITNSEQGRSFQAFWAFLMSSNQRERFESNLGQILEMEPVRAMALPASTRYIHDGWVDAAAHVQETCAQLNAQLRRYVDENYLEEERRILALTRSIESRALALRESDATRGWQLAIDALAPSIELSLDRPLYNPADKPVIAPITPVTSSEAVPDDLLYEQEFIDRMQMLGFVQEELMQNAEVPLSRLLEAHPLEAGLGELVTWAQLSWQHGGMTADNEDEDYCWQDAKGVGHVATTPGIVFKRGGK